MHCFADLQIWEAVTFQARMSGSYCSKLRCCSSSNVIQLWHKYSNLSMVLTCITWISIYQAVHTVFALYFLPSICCTCVCSAACKYVTDVVEPQMLQNPLICWIVIRTKVISPACVKLNTCIIDGLNPAPAAVTMSTLLFVLLLYQ